MSILIVGSNGQLGRALQKLYPTAKLADSSELDITNPTSVENYDWRDIDIIINAAAYTAVDNSETSEGRKSAWKVNAVGVANLAKAAIKNNFTLVHVSSDYVFDGTTENHSEDEDFSPINVYGESKAAGDIATSMVPQHYIARTSWVIGEGKNFVRTMESLAERNIKPSVVSDQIGRLTFTEDLASGIKHLLDTKAPFGTYNITNDGESVSWADITKEIYKQCDKSADDVTPVTTEEYYAGKEGIAPRPLKSTLDITKIKSTGFIPRDWKQSLRDYLAK